MALFHDDDDDDDDDENGGRKKQGQVEWKKNKAEIEED